MNGNNEGKRPDKEFLYENSPIYRHILEDLNVRPDDASDARFMYFDSDGYIHDELLDDFRASYYGIVRFLRAQDHFDTYQKALAEIRNGRKETHWMWFVFPQMRGLSKSKIGEYYGIRGREEAREYVANPVLKGRLIEATRAVLDSPRTAYEIFGDDAVKFYSCVKLFSTICEEPIFNKVLVKYGWR